MSKKKKAIHDSLWDDYNESDYMRQSRLGLDVSLVRRISEDKAEPNWMLEKRLESLKLYEQMPLPTFGPDLSKLDLNNITYYAKAVKGQAETWDDVPADIKNTFDRLGIPKAEQEVLAGVGAQYESTMVYHSLKEEYKKKGVIFEDLDVALKKYPELVEPYFMKVMPASLHKFSALHGAVWSGGTFLYIPAGLKLKQPLQAYFRMNAKGMGQFEHTLIIVEKHAEAHYIEGCSAPRYGADSLHAGGVEIYVKEGARFRYSSVESWSKDAYNLNTKRAIVEKDAHMEWVGGNFGSNTTMLYPCSILVGEGASADHLGVAFAGDGQIQDTGAKVIHAAKNTSSTIVMKSISKGGGKSVYRGSVEIKPEADNAAVSVKCDALILDDKSVSDTIPAMKIDNATATIAHEASAGKISAEDLFYLRSRGLKEDEAAAMIVNGFIEPITKELPLEYSVEMNRMVELEMENSVG
ncbi:Fe-S cluster assembly protein SufB [Candidatus Falkowbacteria bacterium HGW-Falkowbacteria-2]|uniref:Fe-S cluster assembly protein SufB n=1 Tax=Candidatus Falkowbacteria bacterium HGW-Falkowbacteria-2 TaxID=2013769 RepID=A0A2N2E287_9BACT|nr:MAG: Fe-S cluster assembly protein SufB [Candidatus Falkowbacteria bacterium HGW-Falkowbacteria-2]